MRENRVAERAAGEVGKVVRQRDGDVAVGLPGFFKLARDIRQGFPQRIGRDAGIVHFLAECFGVNMERPVAARQRVDEAPVALRVAVAPD